MRYYTLISHGNETNDWILLPPHVTLIMVSIPSSTIWIDKTEAFFPQLWTLLSTPSVFSGSPEHSLEHLAPLLNTARLEVPNELQAVVSASGVREPFHIYRGTRGQDAMVPNLQFHLLSVGENTDVLRKGLFECPIRAAHWTPESWRAMQRYYHIKPTNKNTFARRDIYTSTLFNHYFPAYPADAIPTTTFDLDQSNRALFASETISAIPDLQTILQEYTKDPATPVTLLVLACRTNYGEKIRRISGQGLWTVLDAMEVDAKKKDEPKELTMGLVQAQNPEVERLYTAAALQCTRGAKLKASDIVAYIADVKTGAWVTTCVLRPPPASKPGEYEFTLLNMCTLPAYRRRGLAAKLFRHVETQVPRTTLFHVDLFKTNHAAHAFYERLGFQLAGCTPTMERMDKYAWMSERKKE